MLFDLNSAFTQAFGQDSPAAVRRKGHSVSEICFLFVFFLIS
jgi:hypothetical protein